MTPYSPRWSVQFGLKSRPRKPYVPETCLELSRRELPVFCIDSRRGKSSFEEILLPVTAFKW